MNLKRLQKNMDEKTKKELNSLEVDLLKSYKFPSGGVSVFMFGFFNGNKILFIGQNPGRLKVDEDTKYAQFYREKDIDKMREMYERALKSPAGTIGKFLDKVSGKDWSDISFTNVIKNPMVEQFDAHAIDYEYYYRILGTQINILRPRAIVAMGTLARAAAMTLGKKYIHVEHPSYLLKNRKFDEGCDELKTKIQKVLSQQTLLAGDFHASNKR